VFIVNTPHPAREKLKLDYDQVAQFNSAADLRRHHRLWRHGDRTRLFRIRPHGLLVADRFAFSLHDAGAPPTWPFAGTGDAPSGVGLFAAIVTSALSARNARAKVASVYDFAFGRGPFGPPASRFQAGSPGPSSHRNTTKKSGKRGAECVQSSDKFGSFLVATPDKIPALAAGIGPH